jgi:hypothetical protein
VFNATFNNISAISWWSVLLVEETGVPGETNGVPGETTGVPGETIKLPLITEILQRLDLYSLEDKRSDAQRVIMYKTERN